MSIVKKILIGLGILFALFMVFAIWAVETTDKPLKKIDLDNRPELVAPEPEEEPANTVLGGKSKHELFEECKGLIKQQLDRPASLDASLLSLALGDVQNSQHVMWFDFTAKNAFDAEIKYSAKCLFASGNGALLSAEIVDPL